MIKKLMLAVATMFAATGLAFAQVEINKADAAALDGVKGVSAKMSKVILDERAKGGEFKDWADFQQRVKGVGEKSAVKLSRNGLQVAGKSKDGAAAGKVADARAARPATAAKAADKAATAPAAAKQ